MNDSASGNSVVSGDSPADGVQYYKKDFWSKENLKFSQPHFRLEKASRIISAVASGRDCDLFDVGCGPSALMPLLPENIHYYGIDISIPNPAPNLIEADFLESPLRFDDRKFDIILAQGVIEYVGEFQPQKFAEIQQMLKPNGTFIVSYVNFSHRKKQIYWPYSNVQPLSDFRKSLARYFRIDKSFPTSHNWRHSEPNRRFMKAMNMHINVNIPVISPALAVEYFFICSSYDSRRPRTRP